VGWSIAEYLASLENGVEVLLREKDKGESQVHAKKPSDLAGRIGKRAYELFEEHGREDGAAAQDWAQDWKTAEGEIQKEIANAVNGQPAPEAKAEPKPEPKENAGPKPQAKAEPKSESKVEPATADKAAPASEEPKPATKGQ
jgi:hypothetical protein